MWVSVCVPCKGYLSIWFCNPIGYNEDVVSAMGGGLNFDILHQIQEKVVSTINVRAKFRFKTMRIRWGIACNIYMEQGVGSLTLKEFNFLVLFYLFFILPICLILYFNKFKIKLKIRNQPPAKSSPNLGKAKTYTVAPHLSKPL